MTYGTPEFIKQRQLFDQNGQYEIFPGLDGSLNFHFLSAERVGDFAGHAAGTNRVKILFTGEPGKENQSWFYPAFANHIADKTFSPAEAKDVLRKVMWKAAIEGGFALRPFGERPLYGGALPDEVEN